MNVALAGIKIEYKRLTERNDETGVNTTYNVIEFNTYQVEFNEKNEVVLTKKIANLSSIKVPIETHLRNVTYTNEDHTLRFFFDTATGEDILPVSLDDLATEFIDKIEDLKKQHELDIQKLQDNLNAEISRATEAEENLRNALNDEITRAKEQEAILQDNIDNEVIRAQAAEDHISQDLANEIDRATRRETELQEAITAETNRATEVEQTLQNDLNDLEAKHDAYEEQTDASLTRMYPKVFPLSVSVSGGGTFKLGTSQNPTIT